MSSPKHICNMFFFQGRIAKKHKGSKDFNRRSAEESFRSLVKTHEKYGWVTPPLADG
jgi:ubiquitin-conjugating enzyme E2 Q